MRLRVLSSFFYLEHCKQRTPLTSTTTTTDKKERKKKHRRMNPTTPTEVHYLSTTTILPSSSTHMDSTQRRRIELTPWDLILLPLQTIQRGLLFIKPKSKSIEEEEQQLKIHINHLKSSLSEVLNHFYPLAGRLSTTLHKEDNNNTSSVYIDCNSTGAEFIHAITNHEITVSDILNPICVSKIVKSFFPHNGATNYDGRSKPLISVQVTELLDGIFIGCSVNHSVCDGTSFWHFINAWSEIARHDQISRLPIFNRSEFFNESNFPIRFPFNIDEKFKETHVVDHQQSPLEDRFFHFSSQNIAKLKSKANSECGYDPNCQISSFQALMAHVWLAVTRARHHHLDSNEETTYQLLMGSRSRLNPPLPEKYFGNSVVVGTAKANVGELLEGGHGFAASLLNQVVKSHTNESVRCFWKSWVEKPMFIFPNYGLVSNALMVGSSPRFNIYGNDFGWGRPIAVRTGCANKFLDGKITVNPGAVEGSIDVEVYLSLENLKAMGDDAKFMEFVSILHPFQQKIVASRTNEETEKGQMPE